MLDKLLQEPYYAEVKDRIEKGQLVIDVGPVTWREGLYNDPYGRVSLPFALNLADKCKNIQRIRVYYHAFTDNHHIRFEHDGEEYIVRWYKVFVLCRKSDLKEINFGYRDHDILSSFERGLHRHPSEHWRNVVGNIFE